MPRISGVFRICALSFVFLLTTTPADSANAEGWTPEAMFKVNQVGDVQASSDGKRVAYVVRRAVMDGDSSEFVSQIYVADADGKNSFQLTQGDASSFAPQWSPDDARIAFLSKRSGKSQVWIIGMKGGEAGRLTSAEGGVGHFRWSPDGQRIAYVATDAASDEEQKRSRLKDNAQRGRPADQAAPALRHRRGRERGQERRPQAHEGRIQHPQRVRPGVRLGAQWQVDRVRAHAHAGRG